MTTGGKTYTISCPVQKLAAAGGASPTALRSYLPILIIAILAATPLAKNLWAKLSTRGRQVAVPVLMLAGLALATAYLVDGTYNPFLYFRF